MEYTCYTNKKYKINYKKTLFIPIIWDLSLSPCQLIDFEGLLTCSVP